MKMIFIIAVLVFGVVCKAQITTLPIYSCDDYQDGVDIYYKDTFLLISFNLPWGEYTLTKVQ